jgi:hypothetical protein
MHKSADEKKKTEELVSAKNNQEKVEVMLLIKQRTAC